MPSTDHDLSMTTYALIGLLVVGHEVAGVRSALLLGLALGGLLIGISLVVALISHLLAKQEHRQPPQMGGAAPAGHS
jgi:hypothetical protein